MHTYIFMKCLWAILFFLDRSLFSQGFWRQGSISTATLLGTPRWLAQLTSSSTSNMKWVKVTFVKFHISGGFEARCVWKIYVDLLCCRAISNAAHIISTRDNWTLLKQRGLPQHFKITVLIMLIYCYCANTLWTPPEKLNWFFFFPLNKKKLYSGFLGLKRLMPDDFLMMPAAKNCN